MEKTGIEYLLAINLVTFLTFALDQWKAVHNKWRIRESVLFLLVFMGGAAGAVAGMYLCHHKTKKSHFKYGVPAILILETAAIIFLYFR